MKEKFKEQEKQLQSQRELMINVLIDAFGYESELRDVVVDSTSSVLKILLRRGCRGYNNYSDDDIKKELDRKYKAITLDYEALTDKTKKIHTDSQTWHNAKQTKRYDKWIKSAESIYATLFEETFLDGNDG